MTGEYFVDMSDYDGDKILAHVERAMQNSAYSSMLAKQMDNQDRIDIIESIGVDSKKYTEADITSIIYDFS